MDRSAAKVDQSVTEVDNIVDRNVTTVEHNVATMEKMEYITSVQAHNYECNKVTKQIETNTQFDSEIKLIKLLL